MWLLGCCSGWFARVLLGGLLGLFWVVARALLEGCYGGC